MVFQFVTRNVELFDNILIFSYAPMINYADKRSHIDSKHVFGSGSVRFLMEGPRRRVVSKVYRTSDVQVQNLHGQ